MDKIKICKYSAGFYVRKFFMFECKQYVSDSIDIYESRYEAEQAIKNNYVYYGSSHITTIL